MSLQAPSLARPQDCCARSAQTPEAGFCGDCGKPLIWCMAAQECHSVIDRSGMCPVCIQPELYLDAGAASTVREGGKLALPLVIRNAAGIGRPLFVTGLWVKEDDAGWRELPLSFERLDSGRSANVAVRTEVLDHAGVHQVDLRLAIASRYHWREEAFVLTSSIIFPVESKDPNGPVTNINVTADQIGAGLTVYNPTRIEQERAAGQDTHARPIPLKLNRADQDETRLGRRGYDNGLRVPRAVSFAWRGFAEGDCPADGPILDPSGILYFGRNAVGHDQEGNDARLLVSQADGALSPLTGSISRQHFSIYPESGRLMLRVESQFGLRVNGDAYGRTKSVLLEDGAVISPLRKSPDALTVTVNFEAEREDVTRILLTRTCRA
ncbi:FHA domain-containing protein [Henriciella aquimarina]|uniref:FHA domain-containing protein n=1 Tax=Henriciella aquimarina TaxID=545261 RepID=UPI000A05579A|nr:FHA domain-containing protein [Henriciella aquimarina]